MSPGAPLAVATAALLTAGVVRAATPESAGPDGPPRVEIHAGAADLASLADRAWWAPRVPAGVAPFPGTTGNKASDCADCHDELHAEWAASTHARAWVDPQFQVELHKDPEVAWICINCHTPAGDQQAELVDWAPEHGVRDVPRRDNPTFDAEWQQEGITCLTCHWREEGIAAVHEDVQAPHPTVHAPELREAGLCLSCHQAAVRLEDALVCSFTTGEEWEAGQAAGTVPDQPCQHCHMPTVERASAPGAPTRITRRHAWPGALIPKDDVQAEAMADIGLVPLGEEGAWPWAPGVDTRITAPGTAAPGSRVAAAVEVHNARAGHMVPSGDPERYLLLTATVEDAAGRTIAGGRARYGQRWMWWPVARKLADDRIPPGQTATLDLPFVMPAGGAVVRVRLEHFRISPENADYHGLDDYPRSRVVADVEARVAPAGRDEDRGSTLPEGGRLR